MGLLMPNPLVSICVPTRNRADRLKESLRSIQAQEYEPLKILISDNASEDGTEALCREAQRADPRIRYVRHPKNIGLYGNHNFCIDESKGEFFCFFHDHDDRDPRLVRAYADFLQAHPNVGVVCSDWELTEEDKKRVGVRRYPVAPVTAGADYTEQTLRSGRSSIAAPGAMIRREALGKIRFDEQGPIGFGDFVVWFEIAERWSIGHIPEILWSCRQEPKAQSARTIVSMVYDYDVNLNRYCDGHLQRWPGHAEQVRRWRRHIRNFLFWALAFEVGLHLRKNGCRPAPSSSRTLFELFDYHLPPEAFDQALERLRFYRAGAVQHAAFAMLETMRKLRITAPITWATSHSGLFRNLLGLRE